MDARFTQHLLQTQANEMVKYIETLEKNNETMLKFIQQNGLGDAFSQFIDPQEAPPVPTQASMPIVEVQE